MRRSRSEAAETRERIVSIASAMFLERGLAGVGMRDIMSASGLTQGGFYRHFASKEQLVAEALGAAFERLSAMFDKETEGLSAGAALERIVSVYLNQCQVAGKPYLCPLSMMGAELSHADPLVQKVVMDGRRGLVEMIAARLVHLKKAEAMKVASGVLSAMVGAVTLANLTADKAEAAAILRDAHVLIRGRIAVDGAVTRRKSRVG